MYDQNNIFVLEKLNNIKLSALFLFVIPILAIFLNVMKLQFISDLCYSIAYFYFAYSIYIFALDQNHTIKQESTRIAISFLILGILDIFETFIPTAPSINTTNLNQSTYASAVRSLTVAAYPAIVILIVYTIPLLLGYIWFTQLFNRILNTHNMQTSNNLKYAAILQASGSVLIIISLVMLLSLLNQLITSGFTQSDLNFLAFIAIILLIGALLAIAALIVQVIAWYQIYKRVEELEITIHHSSINISSTASQSPDVAVSSTSYGQTISPLPNVSNIPNNALQTQNQSFSKPSQSMLERPVFCSNCGMKLREDSKYCSNCGHSIL